MIVIGKGLFPFRCVRYGEDRMKAPQQRLSETSLVSDSDERATSAANTPAHILVAEDDPDHSRWLRLVLERAGARVTAVDDGLSAVEQATAAWRRGEPFDLVVMDVLMPRLDGLDATRRLRAAGYPRPIVAVTACAMQGDREKCLAAGCDEYAAKPIAPAALVALAARWLPAGAVSASLPSAPVRLWCGLAFSS